MPQKFLKDDYDTEEPWRYMGDLPLEHVPTVRRVMILIYHKLNPRERIFPMPHLNWTYLTRKERKRVIAMIQESRENDLLIEMLRWFSAQFMSEDEEVAEAAQTLKELVVNAVRQPKIYQVEYLEERRNWNEFMGRAEDQDTDMDGMGSRSRLSTTPHWPPSEFVTSIGQPQGGSHDITRLPVSVRNTLNGTRPFVASPFRPSYSHESENWRQEICFSYATSAEAYYNQGWGQTSFSTISSESQEIELPYSFTTADEDVSTESDPCEEEEEVNIFATVELPGRKTRRGKEFASYIEEPTSKKAKTSIIKAGSTPKMTGSPKTTSTAKMNKPNRINTPGKKAVVTSRKMLAASSTAVGSPNPNIKTPNGINTPVGKTTATSGKMLEASRTIKGSPKTTLKSSIRMSGMTLPHRAKFVDEDDEIDDWEPDT